MSQPERLYKLHHLFTSGACPTRQQLLRDFEISPAAYFIPSWTVISDDRGRYFSGIVDAVSG